MAVAMAQPQQPPALQRQHLETQSRLAPPQKWVQPLHPKSNANPTKELSIPQPPSFLPKPTTLPHCPNSAAKLLSQIPCFLVSDVHLLRRVAHKPVKAWWLPGAEQEAKFAIFMLRLLRVRSLVRWLVGWVVCWFCLLGRDCDVAVMTFLGAT